MAEKRRLRKDLQGSKEGIKVKNEVCARGEGRENERRRKGKEDVEKVRINRNVWWRERGRRRPRCEKREQKDCRFSSFEFSRLCNFLSPLETFRTPPKHNILGNLFIVHSEFSDTLSSYR